MYEWNIKKKLFLIVILGLIISSYKVYGVIKNEPVSSKSNHLSFQVLKEKIKNVVTYEEAEKIITNMYGKPYRYVGSGLIFPQWYIDGGFLTCHPSFGVSYSTKKDFDVFDGSAVYFIDSENKVSENLVAAYVMINPQSDVNNTQYWLGILKLETNGEYIFKDDREKESIDDQKNNFFINNPVGTYTIEYQKNIKADDLLENMKDGTILAKLKFTSGKNSEILYFCRKGRAITIKPIDSIRLTYYLFNFWENYYHKPTGIPKNPTVEYLKETIKNVGDYEKVFKMICDMYGEPSRDAGNGGIYIPQWDIEGGVLTCHPYEGVSYYKDNRLLYLIETHNKVGEITRGVYMMFALSQKEPNKTSYWLGNIQLKANWLYTVNDGLNQKPKNNQIDNFFTTYPDGTYTIEYQNNIKADDLLENLQDGAKIAKVSFFAGENIEEFDIYIKGRTLVLKPTDGKVRTYTLYRYWENYYVPKDGEKD